MTQLDDHIDRVERYGFVRDVFPVEYNGHHLILLKNDAHFDSDDRLLFHFLLYCKRCKCEASMSGRFPESFDDHTELVVNAKVATFADFEEYECKH